MNLNRIHILYIGTALSLLIALINRLDISYHSTVTDGLVIKIESKGGTSGMGGTTYYPVVKFKAGTRDVHFYAEENLDIHPGDAVQVIYNTRTPENAYIYTLGGFWINPFFWCMAPFVILLSFVFSYLHAGDIVRVEFSRRLKLQLIRDPNVLERERLEAEHKEQVKQKSLDAMKKRQGGRR